MFVDLLLPQNHVDDLSRQEAEFRWQTYLDRQARVITKRHRPLKAWRELLQMGANRDDLARAAELVPTPGAYLHRTSHCR